VTFPEGEVSGVFISAWRVQPDHPVTLRLFMEMGGYAGSGANGNRMIAPRTSGTISSSSDFRTVSATSLHVSEIASRYLAFFSP